MKLASVIWLATASMAAAQTEASQPSPPALQRVYECTQIEAGDARLTCYDEAVGRLRTQEQSGEVVAIDRAQAAEMQRDAFGFSLPSLSGLIPRLGSSTDVDRIEAQVERIVSAGGERVRFVLNNGQSWTQVEARSVRNVREGDTVAIGRAALGSYMLFPTRAGAAYRVHRDN